MRGESQSLILNCLFFFFSAAPLLMAAELLTRRDEAPIDGWHFGNPLSISR